MRARPCGAVSRAGYRRRMALDVYAPRRIRTPSAVDQDGRVNVASLKEDVAFLSDQGLLNDPNVSVDAAVDLSFAENAVKTLGIYKPHK